MATEDGLGRVRIARAIPALVGAALALARVLPIADPDYHWHLATGRWIAEHRAVPRVDPFSHTFAGAPWKFVDWLADLAMYGLHRLGGDAAVTLAFALLGGLAVSLAAEASRRAAPNARAPEVFAIAVLIGAVVAFRTTPRPQTATFAVLAALVLLLERARETPRWLLATPVLIALWQNVHSSALLGVLVLFAHAVGRSLERRPARPWWLASFASAAALLVAVRPLDRLAAGFDHLGDRRVAELFPEWGQPFVPGVFGGWVVAALLLMALALVGFFGDRSERLETLLSAAGLSIVGLVSARFLPLSAIGLGPLALAGLASLRRRRGGSVVVAFAGVAAVAALASHMSRPGLGLARGAFPERAAAFAKEHALAGKVFNDFHFGGYLIWTLGERAPVFVDGRSMALYGVEFVREAVSATDSALERMLDERDVSIAIVPPDRRLGAIQRKPGWSLLFFDDTAAVLVRDRDHDTSLAYRAVMPGAWFDLSQWANDPAKLARAQAEAGRARAEAPDSSLAAVLSISVALVAGDRALADAILADAERRFPGSHRVARAGLIRCLATNDRDCACARARVIAREFPGNSYTAKTLTALQCP